MNWKQLNPLPFFKDAGISLFSDGKFSMKRLLAFMFGIGVLYMVYHVVRTIIPPANQNVFEHVFDGLLMIIGTLLLGATWQDVAKNKAKSTVEQTVTETPPTTTTQTTTTPPEHGTTDS
jgi:cation transport ATPase